MDKWQNLSRKVGWHTWLLTPPSQHDTYLLVVLYFSLLWQDMILLPCPLIVIPGFDLWSLVQVRQIFLQHCALLFIHRGKFGGNSNVENFISLWNQTKKLLIFVFDFLQVWLGLRFSLFDIGNRNLCHLQSLHSQGWGRPWTTSSAKPVPESAAPSSRPCPPADYFILIKDNSDLSCGPRAFHAVGFRGGTGLRSPGGRAAAGGCLPNNTTVLTLNSYHGEWWIYHQALEFGFHGWVLHNFA